MPDYPRTEVPAAVQMYVDIIDSLVETCARPNRRRSGIGFRKMARPLISDMMNLRERLIQGPSALTPADHTLMLMLRCVQQSLVGAVHDLEIYQGLKSPFRWLQKRFGV